MDTSRREGTETDGGAPPRLARGIYAILDLDACREAGVDPVATARAFCAARPAAVQLRGKRSTDRQLADVAVACAGLCRTAGVPLVINDRADLALLVGADGVHLGQDDLPPDRVRRLVGPRMLVGWSTHDRGQLETARELPIDYVGFGPVCATRTKERPDPVVGWDGLRDAVRRSRIPVVAIGGLRLEDLAAVRETGAHAAALVSALLAGDPAARIAEATRLFPTRSP